MNGSFLWIVYSVAICWTMVVAISGASIGFLLGPLRWPERLYLYAGAAALFYPTFYADGVGVVMIGLFLAVRRFRGPARRLA